MKIATTIIDSYPYFETPAEVVRFYEGTGFRLLDYSFYTAMRNTYHFLEDEWKKYVVAAKNAADELGFSFVQAHAPNYNPLGGEDYDHKNGVLTMTRSIRPAVFLG